MKRTLVVLLAAAGCLCLSGSVVGQMGMNMFSKPNIADIFKPVVGSGAAYEMQPIDQKRAPSLMEMTIVGKELTPSGEGYWMEVGHTTSKDGGPLMYSKMLVTKDFQFPNRIQQPGQGHGDAFQSERYGQEPYEGGDGEVASGRIGDHHRSRWNI
jgi:hypothetical protein